MNTKFNWSDRISKLSTEKIEELSKHRGYRPEFIRWFSDQGLIGWSGFRGGRWCFPVHCAGEIVASHQIPTVKEESPSYFPGGRGAHPLIVGNAQSGAIIAVFESQWDMMAALDAANFHLNQKGMYIATRGAANKLPDSIQIPEGKTIYAVMQNDPVKNGRSPAQEWLRRIEDQVRWPVRRVDIPAQYEDPQAWLLEAGFGAFKDGLRKATKEAIERNRDGERNRSDKPDKLINPPDEAGISGKSGLSDGDEQLAEEERSPFPAEHLPRIAQQLVSGFVKMTDGRMPLALPSICCLGTLSAAIGPFVRIRSTPQGDTCGANLFLLAGAESSSGKSIPFKRITKPFFQYESELREAFAKEVYPELKSEVDFLEAEKKGILNKATRGKGAMEDRESLVTIEARLNELKHKLESPRLFCGDSTSPALIRLMARQHGTSLSSMSDDARTIMEMIEGKHNKGSNADDSFFIHAWTGSKYAFDRVTERENLVIDAPWLSAMWFVQPDKLTSLSENVETFSSGFFQRLLVCNSGATPLKFSGRKDCFSVAVESAWEELVKMLLETYRRREDCEALIVEPSPEAEERLRNYQNSCVDLQLSTYSDIPTIAGKWGENAWRIALNLHMAEHGVNAIETDLNYDTAERAIQIMNWFSKEALRLVAPAREEKENTRSERLRAILSRPKYDRGKGASQGTLTNNHGFSRDELETLCERYENVFQKIDKDTTEKGGKPTFHVRLKVT